MNEERESINQVEESRQSKENVTVEADEKKKVELFEEVSFDNSEEAKSEMSKEKRNVLIGVASLLATIPWTIGMLNQGEGISDTMGYIFLGLGIAGILVACFTIHLLRYVFKTAKILFTLGFVVPVPLPFFIRLALCLFGIVLAFLALGYVPAAYILIALIGAWKEHEDAKEYLDTQAAMGTAFDQMVDEPSEK